MKRKLSAVPHSMLEIRGATFSNSSFLVAVFFVCLSLLEITESVTALRGKLELIISGGIY